MGLGIQLNDIKYWHQKPSSYVTSSGTASTGLLVKTGEGTLEGLSIAPTGTTGTFKLWDSTAATTTVLVNTTVATTTTILFPHVKFSNGLYLSTANTVNITVFYK